MERQRYNEFPKYWQAAIIRFNFNLNDHWKIEIMHKIVEDENPFVAPSTMAFTRFGMRSELWGIFETDERVVNALNRQP